MYVTMSIAFRLLIAVSNIIDLSNARPLSSVANGDNPVSDPAAAKQVGEEIAPIISGQGAMQPTTAFLWLHITQIGDTPIGVIYESEFLGAEITGSGGKEPNIVLMYPSPTLESVRTIIWRTDKGLRLANLLTQNSTWPLLVKVAQDEYGYQAGNRDEFAQAMALNPILRRGHLIVSQNLDLSVKPPAPTLLQEIINVADPKPYC
jgi:hypothetical protein